MKSVLWRVAKRLFYMEDGRCLKVNTYPSRPTGCTALLNVHLKSSVSNTHIRSSVKHMETRRRSGMPNSSNFPFSLQLGFRALKKFVANKY